MRGGWGAPLAQVARVLFSLCSFLYVRTILSQSLYRLPLQEPFKHNFSPNSSIKSLVFQPTLGHISALIWIQISPRLLDCTGPY